MCLFTIIFILLLHCCLSIHLNTQSCFVQMFSLWFVDSNHLESLLEIITGYLYTQKWVTNFYRIVRYIKKLSALRILEVCHSEMERKSCSRTDIQSSGRVTKRIQTLFCQKILEVDFQDNTNMEFCCVSPRLFVTHILVQTVYVRVQTRM